MKRVLLIGCMLVLGLGLLSGYGMAQMPDPKIMLGHEAPDFTLSALDGVDVTLSKLKGKIVVLDFWATWCRPCRLYMPDLIEVTDGYKDKDVVLYTINQGDAKDVVQKFMELTKLKANVLLDTQSKAGSEYFVSSIPHTVIIGKDGTVQAIHVGAEKKSVLKKELDTLTAGTNLVEPVPTNK